MIKEKIKNQLLKLMLVMGAFTYLLLVGKQKIKLMEKAEEKNKSNYNLKLF